MATLHSCLPCARRDHKNATELEKNDLLAQTHHAERLHETGGEALGDSREGDVIGFVNEASVQVADENIQLHDRTDCLGEHRVTQHEHTRS